MGWAATMGISCDRAADVPVGVQLEWALRALILRGELGAGERLPTLREMADDVGVNSNTVRSVYARLERDGLIDTRHGTGSFVASPPADAHLALVAALDHAGRVARDAGLSHRQLAAMLYVSETEGAAPDREALERRRLRAQISILEQALADLHSRHRELPVQSSPRARARGPRLLDSGELVGQRDALLDQLLEARAAIRAVDEEPAPPARATARAKTPARATPPARPRRKPGPAGAPGVAPA